MGRPGKNSKKSSHKNDETFGRPRDDKLEAAFMIKLRNGRLQVINAESYAELVCNRFSPKKPKTNTKA